jgi:Secretion system C-terminal sorting domain
MKKIFILFIFTPLLLLAQAPAIDWQKAIWTNNNYSVIITSLKSTPDGGFIIGSSSNSNISGDKTENSFGSVDYWIIKTDALGNIQWQRTLGGDCNDVFPVVIPTTDGGYIVGGTSCSPISGNKTDGFIGGLTDYWVIKLDSAGNTVWQNDIGGNEDLSVGAGGQDILCSIIQTPDGGYLVGGTSDSTASGDKSENQVACPPCLPLKADFWVVKLDSLGNIQWDNTIGTKAGNQLFSMTNAVNSDGYVITGSGGRSVSSNNEITGDNTQITNGGSDYWVMKLDLLGNIVWQKSLGGSSGEIPRKIITTSDGSYLVGGISGSNISGNKTENNRGSGDYWLIKLDVLGNVLWDKTLGGSGDEDLQSIVEDTDGGFIVGGYSRSSISGDKTEISRGNVDFWIVKINSTGAILWDKTIGGDSVDEDISIDKIAIDNSYIIAGGSQSGISGDKTVPNNGTVQIWLLKLAPENLQNQAFANINFQVYPNPTTGIININFGKLQQKVTLTLENILGQKVSSKTFSQIENTTYEIEGSSGFYFLSIENENHEKKTFKIFKN